MAASERTGRLEGTPGWGIGADPEGEGLEFMITLDDSPVVSTPMSREEAEQLSSMLTEAVRQLDAGELAVWGDSDR
ncbi:hypothetical protein [Kocuria palustris]|uniref:hypothetical protein n=1 Tax=Kocuria palustris TaxID=71999 RepID=UPI0021A62813|nr:hypothetical protein [Kocuria palustris]MCT1590481.1 hypothetical protein [Kocuria palustris]